MQSILTAHYCFSAGIITMKNMAEYWLRVFVLVFFSSFLYTSSSFLPKALQFYLSRSLTGGWMYEAQRRRGKQAVTEGKQSFILSSSAECIIPGTVSVHHWRGEKVFLIVPFIKELQLIKRFACEKCRAFCCIRSTGVCKAAQWWWATAHQQLYQLYQIATEYRYCL